MKSFSLTITGIAVYVLSQFIPVEEAQVIGEAIGIVMAYVGRIRIGDLTWFGSRK